MKVQVCLSVEREMVPCAGLSVCAEGPLADLGTPRGAGRVRAFTV